MTAQSSSMLNLHKHGL